MLVKDKLVNLYKQNQQRATPMAVVVLVVAVAGVVGLSSSGAAGFTTALEIETGNASGNYTTAAGDGASGQATTFGPGATTPGPTPPSTPGTWDPRQPGPNDLFMATDGSINYLRTPIPPNPRIDPKSSAILGSMTSNTPTLNGPLWQKPIYMTSNSDPIYNPSFSYDWNCSVGGSIHIPDIATREVPSPGDEWVIVANKDDNTVKAIWIASKSSGKWNGGCGGSFKMNGNGTFETVLDGIGVGSDMQASAGFILFSEIQTGAIEHALYVTSQQNCSSGFRKPAYKSDGKSSASNCMPMGARIQLDPSVDCNGLAGASKGEKMVCVAMQKYGAYMADSGGPPGAFSGIGIAGDDLTDPNRQPWQKPGNGMRGSRNCAPVGPNCGIYANVGLVGGPEDFSNIPWEKTRILASWNGQ